MQAGTKLIYVDAKGQEHNALAISENGLNPGRVTLTYVENTDIVKLFDVAHMSDPSKQENNPNLPNYSLNCWKHEDEYSQAPPSDHPIFDKQFKQPDLDDNSKVISIQRPKFEADKAAVGSEQPETPSGAVDEGLAAGKTEGAPSQADLDTVAAEQKAAE